MLKYIIHPLLPPLTIFQKPPHLLKNLTKIKFYSDRTKTVINFTLEYIFTVKQIKIDIVVQIKNCTNLDLTLLTYSFIKVVYR